MEGFKLVLDLAHVVVLEEEVAVGDEEAVEVAVGRAEEADEHPVALLGEVGIVQVFGILAGIDVEERVHAGCAQGGDVVEKVLTLILARGNFGLCAGE